MPLRVAIVEDRRWRTAPHRQKRVDKRCAAPPKIPHEPRRNPAKARRTWSHPSFGGGEMLSPASQRILIFGEALPTSRAAASPATYHDGATCPTFDRLNLREDGWDIAKRRADQIADPKTLS